MAHTPLIPAPRKQRQADLCELEAILVYRASSRTARATQRNPVLKNETKQNKTKKKPKQQQNKQTKKTQTRVSETRT